MITGCKNEHDAKLSCRKFARVLQKLGYQPRIADFKAQNIVASCDVRFPIRIEGLALHHFHAASYEPELFPGLVYRLVNPKVVILVFVSGKIVLTGAKSNQDIREAFTKIYPVLKGRSERLAKFQLFKLICCRFQKVIVSLGQRM